MTHLERERALLPLRQAYCEGKVIQRRMGNDTWTDVPEPGFGDVIQNYRIKPEPREWWLIGLTNEELSIVNAHNSRAKAETSKNSFPPSSDVQIIHVKEVL